jgi:hypothetical protein
VGGHSRFDGFVEEEPAPLEAGGPGAGADHGAARADAGEESGRGVGCFCLVSFSEVQYVGGYLYPRSRFFGRFGGRELVCYVLWLE